MSRVVRALSFARFNAAPPPPSDQEAHRLKGHIPAEGPISVASSYGSEREGVEGRVDLWPLLGRGDLHGGLVERMAVVDVGLLLVIAAPRVIRIAGAGGADDALSLAHHDGRLEECDLVTIVEHSEAGGPEAKRAAAAANSDAMRVVRNMAPARRERKASEGGSV
eukprot:CAMPEP_0171197954 /NCGR_PEP_ID=MMETSP0790-20130122/22674_1 /TAXON_ID=2925 /ORGANISM="Alexandrium catenella, Strain OF101" /LENGTH=164 /DNA_ID=CAMNT_0011663205 /DNA_START=37 /DNA_END=533 /DNA_ORIENTATION=+